MVDTSVPFSSVNLSVGVCLSAGTSDGLNEFFRADDYDGTNGNFNKIVNAELVTTEEINIPR